jgi:hypothetical protein
VSLQLIAVGTPHCRLLACHSGAAGNIISIPVASELISPEIRTRQCRFPTVIYCRETALPCPELLFFLAGFPSAAVEIKRIIFAYRFPTFKTQKKPMPRLIIPGAVESRGRLGTAIATFDSDCSGHCYFVSSSYGFLRAGKNHAAGAGL